mmetsp:Transcript_49494/g.115774  ORF Transcript_49494/g.115774 Transcript_49494/m.115774 type:complete len:201 (+) Transcript_49494:617-1219(+)
MQCSAAELILTGCLCWLSFKQAATSLIFASADCVYELNPCALALCGRLMNLLLSLFNGQSFCSTWHFLSSYLQSHHMDHCHNNDKEREVHSHGAPESSRGGATYGGILWQGRPGRAVCKGIKQTCKCVSELGETRQNKCRSCCTTLHQGVRCQVKLILQNAEWVGKAVCGEGHQQRTATLCRGGWLQVVLNGISEKRFGG